MLKRMETGEDLDRKSAASTVGLQQGGRRKLPTINAFRKLLQSGHTCAKTAATKMPMKIMVVTQDSSWVANHFQLTPAAPSSRPTPTMAPVITCGGDRVKKGVNQAHRSPLALAPRRRCNPRPKLHNCSLQARRTWEEDTGRPYCAAIMMTKEVASSAEKPRVGLSLAILVPTCGETLRKQDAFSSELNVTVV